MWARFFSSLRSTGATAAVPLNTTGAAVALAVSSALGVAAFMRSDEVAASDALHPPQYPWNHKGWMNGFDYASVKRGYQVYREVCSACHSLDRIAFRNLVGVVFTEEEAKAHAATFDIQDGPNDDGEMFTRPGKLSDYLPAPYPNKEAAKAAQKAYPPDLSLVVKAREGAEDYVFALLTGYKDAPAGVSVGDLYYNPYFPGGAIAMAPPLSDGAIDYDDGTPTTLTQLAKDVVTFLAWAAEPEADERKQMGLKFCFVLALMTAFTAYYKKLRWSNLKTRRIFYNR